MPKRRLVYGHWLVALALLAPSVVIAAQPAPGKQLRLKISLEVKGSYQNTGEIKHGSRVRASIDNSYRVEYVVPAGNNPHRAAEDKPAGSGLAEGDGRLQRQGEGAQRQDLSQRRQPAQTERGGWRAAWRRILIAMPSPELIAKIKACGTDQACKQQVAMEMMSQQMPTMPSGPNAQVQADIQAISDLCAKKGKIGTKAHEDCMNAEGRKRSTVPPSAADDEPEVAELPDRYFLYRVGIEAMVNGVIDCKFKGHTKINESTTSAVADVGGMGELTFGHKGEGDADPKALQPCANEQAVFDTKTNTFWLQGLHPAGIPLTGINGEASPDEVRIPSDIEEWVSASLHGVPARGTKTQKFDYRTAKVSWSIVKE